MWREGSEGERFYLIKLYLTRPSLPPANKGWLLGRQGSEADENVSNIIDGQTGNGVLPSIKAWKRKPSGTVLWHPECHTHLWRSPWVWRRRTGCIPPLSAPAGSSSSCSWGWCESGGPPGAGGRRRPRQGARRWQGGPGPLARSLTRGQRDTWRTLVNKSWSVNGGIFPLELSFPVTLFHQIKQHCA